ncbi:MAG TPA: peptidoglycan recognition protein, partial [Candidatus Eisenbacteria bacterium]|nr:peptidoglycan recognition protein [Candidatus Eisenbacteria bacterium]
MVGVTWRNGSADDVTVLVRTHTGGSWTGWSSLDQASVGTEQVRSTRTGTEPYYAGPSDGVQVRVDVRAGRAPADLRVELVDPGDSPADAHVGQTPPAAASAAIGMPTIYTRAQWGADESLRNSGPRYSSTIKGGFVHHTDGANGYSSSDVPKIIRGIYAYHVLSNGWSDIGYNFLVDRFGRIWEGRYGGMDRPVIGAHTAGFNTDTFGVAAIGNYDTTAAPSAMLSGIARVMAWKLSLHYRNPNGTMTLTSGGGDTNRYPAGTVVTKPTISAHRDMGYTACPGQYLYAQLATIRSQAASYLGAGLVNPTSSATQAPYQGSPITLTSGVLRSQGWRLEVHERCSGRVVRAFSGTASPSSPMRTVWDLRDGSGSFVRPGVYDATLSTWSGSLTGRPWTQPITVTTTTPATSVSPVPAPGESSFVAVNPQRIYDSRSGGQQPLGPQGQVDLKVLGAGGVPASGVAAVALNVTGTCPTANTYFTVWPAGVARPNSSSLNLTAGSTRAALTVSAVGGG